MTIYTDDFNRTDENPITGNWTALTTRSGTFKVVSNGLGKGENGDMEYRYNVGTLGPDCYCQCAYKNPHGSITGIGVVLRANTTNTFYLAYICYTTAYWYKCVSGSFTNMASASITDPTEGQILKATAIGSSLKLYIDGVEKVSHTDTAITGAGYCGAEISVANSGYLNEPHIDNWEAGDISSGVAIPVFMNQYRQRRR